MLQQQPPTGSSFTAASFIGSYALTSSGLVGIGEEERSDNSQRMEIRLTSALARFTSGTLDINNFGTLQAGQAK